MTDFDFDTLAGILARWGLRRGDAEMIDLETAYIGRLHENRAVFGRS